MNINSSQYMPKDYCHQLIVIGNGFDLECGLKSSFKDFIKARKEQFDLVATKEKDDDLSFHKNMWDVILESNEDGNWCDIETAISNWLPDSSSGDTGVFTEFMQCSKKLNQYYKQEVPIQETTKLSDKVAIYLKTKFGDTLENFSYSDLYEISRKELTIFENDFSKYLEHEVKNNSRYEERTIRLLQELLVYDCQDYRDYELENSVLSFNYTSKPPIGMIKDADYVNIHGYLGEEIVFGIDGGKSMADSHILPFTKTYRLMGLNLHNTRNLIHAPSNGLHIGSNEGTTIIKFYGHSLGKADYSYFQAIFDSVKLYESKTRLIFYFRPHNGGNEMSARTEMMKKATQLLIKYGQTLDNREHGRNLIHKLLIEGRLAVTELQTMNL